MNKNKRPYIAPLVEIIKQDSPEVILAASPIGPGPRTDYDLWEDPNGEGGDGSDLNNAKGNLFVKGNENKGNDDFLW